MRVFQFAGKVFLLSLTIVFLLSFSKGWQLITEGFRLDKIERELEEEDDRIPSEEIINILDQDFYYFSKGCQVYVFESKDKKYVLKLLRYHKYNIPFWTNHISMFSWGKKYRESRLSHREKSYDMTIGSYNIANDKLSYETGLLYLHLKKTNCLKNNIKLIDRLGRVSTIDLNTHGFMIQKKVGNLKSLILDLKRKEDHSKLNDIMDSFLKMIISVYKKGVVIRDYNCLKNAGYVDNRVVEMDVGSLYPSETDLNIKSEFEYELRNFVKHFRKWSSKRYRNILPIFDKKVDEIINNYDDIWNDVDDKETCSN